MPKLQKITRSNSSFVYSVNLPLDMIEELGWEKGDDISLEVKERKIIMVSKEEGGETSG